MSRSSFVTKTRFAWLAIVFLMVSGCAKPIIVSEVEPDGSLAILGPGPRFAQVFESGRWISSGDLGPGALVITEKSGRRALLIPPGDQQFTILRPIDAILLSTPYLGWSWLVEHQESEYHEVSILVGFRSSRGSPEQASFDTLPDAASQTPANRAIKIRWAASALQRGDLSSTGDGSVPFYVARGGRENTGRWWSENVDLSALYARLWPGDSLAGAHIVFVAIIAGENRSRSPTYLANMRLFR